MMQWQLINDEREKYSAYLASREWAEKRRAVHKRASGRCERCWLNAIDNVHHLTYERKYNERLDDLWGICRGCHEFIHARTNIDPRNNHVEEMMRPCLQAPGEQEALSLCPFCKYDYIHLGIPSVESGNMMLVRGDVVVIPFWGECGHHWDQLYGEHKGQVFNAIIPRYERADKQRQEDSQNGFRMARLHF